MSLNVLRLLALAAVAHVSIAVSAAIVHDEAIDDDLSNDPAAPTAFGTLGFGETEFRGQTVLDGLGVVDRDYLSFTIGAGASLSGINLNAYSAPDDNRAFIGLYAGSTASTPAGANPTREELLGGAHINAALGVDIFDEIADLFGENKFSGPLGPGDYTLLVQQTGLELSEYTVGVVVTPIPAALPLLVTALAGLGFAMRRRAGA